MQTELISDNEPLEGICSSPNIIALVYSFLFVFLRKSQVSVLYM